MIGASRRTSRPGRLGRPGLRPRFAALAFACAVLLAFLSVAAGALHHHDFGSRAAANLDCRACAWTHATATGLGHAPPALVSLETAVAPRPADSPDVQVLTPTKRTTRGPPSLSL